MRVLFSRNFAYAKFRENKPLAKISEFTVNHALISIQNMHHTRWNVTALPLSKDFKVIQISIFNDLCGNDYDVEGVIEKENRK